ncbi:MAG TPA: ComEC/Rec2 family competence protein [Rhodopila sp.]|uniref:ComEC/Rec2 family competence protein n=1 Tax=Rhodopila sp. TaxID=2480087 RepID=UPI002CB938ED|nr:ComEC/Rec2 family competence protein [Rhodopila sp.]HVY13766.1 ComEC/Rec2 family competence protein [Rhodopila sp.]
MRLVAGARAWLEAERDRLPLWLPVFVGAGVATYYALRFEPPFWTGAVACAGLVLPAALVPPSRLLLVPLAAMALGFAAGQVATARAPPIETAIPSKAVIVSGVAGAVEMLPEGRRVTVTAASLDGAPPLRRWVRIRLRRGDDTTLEAGDPVRVRALLRPPAMPAYPGAWDLQRDAYYSGLGASGFALGQVERGEAAQRPTAARVVQGMRERIARRVLAVVHGSPGAFAVTLLTGTSMAIPEADHAAFRDSGLAHLLAVAGLHIGIVMGFVLAASRLAFRCSEHASLFWPTKKLSALCALAGGGAYMVLTGMHVPIVRSFLMAGLFTIAVLADRRPVSMRGLALAATVLMLLSPQDVPDVSFQMSFSAVLALIAGYEALRPWLRRLHGRTWARRFASHCVALALTSALAGTASAPFGAYHFGHVQVYFILANMVAVPLTALWVMPAGLIALALMPLHLEALALVPMGWGAALVVEVARWTAALPAATFDVPHMPVWGLCAFSLGLAWVGLWRWRWRLAGLAPMAVGVMSPLLFQPPDLLVSADARLIAVRTPIGAFVQPSQDSALASARFVADSWSQFWAVGSLKLMPDTGAEGDAAAPPVRCEDASCRLQPYPGRKAALLVRGDMLRANCSGVSVIVSLEPARHLCPKPWPALVDRFTVWRFGSAAIWLGRDRARVLTDRADRGKRPWVPPLPKPKPAPAPTLPWAEIDTADGPWAP